MNCPTCGYDLSHLPTRRCPECGIVAAVPEARTDRRFKLICFAGYLGWSLVGTFALLVLFSGAFALISEPGDGAVWGGCAVVGVVMGMVLCIFIPWRRRLKSAIHRFRLSDDLVIAGTPWLMIAAIVAFYAAVVNL